MSGFVTKHVSMRAPSTKHAAAVKDKLVAQDPTALGRIALDMTSGIVEPVLQYSNLGLLSITAADGSLVSVGLLNQVFVP